MASLESLEAMSPAEARRMLHALCMHQIELELQNEELRRTQLELDSARARYFDFYDQAPVGYCTVGELGLILEANLTAATHLGVARGALDARPFGSFIFPADKDIYDLYVKQVLKTGESQSCELRMVKSGGTSFWVHLVTSAAPDVNGVRVMLSDISERKCMEEVMHASEQKFRTLAENSPDPIYRYDRDCRRLYVNPIVGKIIGLPVDELIGKSPMDGAILVSEQSRKVMQGIHIVFDSGKLAHTDLDFVAPDGQHRSYSMLLVPERDARGQVVTVLALGRDVTERRLAERRLHASEQTFRAMVEHSPDAITRYDAECRRTYVNPALQALLGFTAEELLGKTPVERSRLRDRPAFMHMLRKVIESGQEFQGEFLFGNAQDVDTWGHFRVVPEFGPGGSVTGVLAATRNISSRKKTEHKLEEIRIRLLSVLKTLPDLVWLKDTNGVYLLCNHAFERFFGAKEADIIGKTDHDFFDAELADFFRQKDREAMDAGCLRINEEWVTFAEDKHRLDKRQVLLETRKVPLVDADGQAVGTLGIARDITERKRIESQLIESQHLLRQLAARCESVREDERRHLAREIHDELGQNLLALRLGISVMGLKFGADNLLLQDKTTRLLEMVDATVKVVRNVATSLRPTALDMGIVSALEWLVDAYPERTGIRCELHVSAKDVPMDDQYATAIFRIVQESLTNVVRHAQANKVDITLTRNEASYFLEVRDNGRGFDPALRPDKSFGLLGIRERALMLGGDVDISSAPGRSTSIKVHIPIHTVPSES